MAQPYLRRYSHEKLLRAGDGSALFELAPRGTAIFLKSNKFDIKRLFGTALFGAATHLCCVRMLAPRGTAVFTVASVDTTMEPIT